ncbi:MAG: anti-sigma factor family protein [Chloroflexota bacterium]
MNHRYFEEWLLAEEDLDASQKSQLEQHVQTCERCRELRRSWQEVRLELKVSEPAIPEAGFTERWQRRLAQVQHKSQQRRAFWAFLLSSAGAVVFAIPLFLLFLPIGSSPILSFWLALYRFTAVVEFMDGVVTLCLTVLRAIGDLFPPTMGIAIGIALIGIWMIWVAAMYRINSVRRTNN